MPGTIDNNGIAIVVINGVVSIELPNLRLVGNFGQENGPGQPDTIIKDFGQLAADGSAGTSTSLWAEFAALGAPSLSLALQNNINAAEMAKAFTGGAVT